MLNRMKHPASRGARYSQDQRSNRSSYWWLDFQPRFVSCILPRRLWLVNKQKLVLRMDVHSKLLVHHQTSLDNPGCFSVIKVCLNFLTMIPLSRWLPRSRLNHSHSTWPAARRRVSFTSCCSSVKGWSDIFSVKLSNRSLWMRHPWICVARFLRWQDIKLASSRPES